MKWNDNGTITVVPPANPKKVTGTRFAAIMGANTWKTPFSTWCEITRTYEEPFESGRWKGEQEWLKIRTSICCMSI